MVRQQAFVHVYATVVRTTSKAFGAIAGEVPRKVLAERVLAANTRGHTFVDV